MDFPSSIPSTIFLDIGEVQQGWAAENEQAYILSLNSLSHCYCLTQTTGFDVLLVRSNRKFPAFLR